jgi:hypothetical protein
MTRTNIGYVADPAAAALREAAIHTTEQELHFGELVKGSRPAHRPVHLLGPPLARAGTYQTSHHWIRITETTEGFEVSIDTSQVGTLRGEITVKGPTGETAIPIDATVVVAPKPPPPTTTTPINPPKPAPSPPSAPPTTQPPLSLPAHKRKIDRVWKIGATGLAVSALMGVIGGILNNALVMSLGGLLLLIASPTLIVGWVYWRADRYMRN